jgi:hypothetical protein
MDFSKPMYTVREANEIIKGCDTLDDIQNVKEILIGEISCYEPSDQGFLMAMMGMQLIKITNPLCSGSQSS